MNHKKSKKGTSTKSFGSTRRVNHDSSEFYNSRLYEGIKPLRRSDIKYVENDIDREYLDKIFVKSSESMSELPDSSVHLMVTSPPYNVGKDYDEDLTLKEYTALLSKVFAETFRVLVPGGRACINVANLGRKPYIPLHSEIIRIMEKMDFFMRGEIIWNKNIGGGTAWGSWLSAANPVLRDQHEYILIFSKQCMSRLNPKRRKPTITKKEFLEFTKSMWNFAPESATKVDHPAPFPVELPYRLIQLYTFEGEVVLDPFMGVGSSAIAALKAKRRFIGYDINKEYVRRAENRIKDCGFQEKLTS